MRVVIDTNIWIRVLLGGRTTRSIMTAWADYQFQLVSSQALLDEFNEVRARPRLSKRINQEQSDNLYRQMRGRANIITLKTIPPRCRDPKDHPVLATAIDGNATAIVSGDNDLRADETLRSEMLEYGVELWGIETFIEAIQNAD